MIANISIFPLGKKVSLSQDIAAAVKVVRESGLDYRLTDMGTIIEGDWDAVMRCLKNVRARVLKNSERIYFNITIDDRKGKRRRLGSKVESVERALRPRGKK